MKNTLILLVALWLPLPALAAEGQVMEIGVSGMVCEFCSASVEKKLRALPGVEDVSVSLDEKRATVVMAKGQAADSEIIRDVIKAAGFTAGEVKIH